MSLLIMILGLKYKLEENFQSWSIFNLMVKKVTTSGFFLLLSDTRTGGAGGAAVAGAAGQ